MRLAPQFHKILEQHKKFNLTSVLKYHVTYLQKQPEKFSVLLVICLWKVKSVISIASGSHKFSSFYFSCNLFPLTSLAFLLVYAYVNTKAVSVPTFAEKLSNILIGCKPPALER